MYKNNLEQDIPFVNSTLKVIASESIDISQDLESVEEKSISELLDEKKEKDKK